MVPAPQVRIMQRPLPPQTSNDNQDIKGVNTRVNSAGPRLITPALQSNTITETNPENVDMTSNIQKRYTPVSGYGGNPSTTANTNTNEIQRRHGYGTRAASGGNVKWDG